MPAIEQIAAETGYPPHEVLTRGAGYCRRNPRARLGSDVVDQTPPADWDEAAMNQAFVPVPAVQQVAATASSLPERLTTMHLAMGAPPLTDDILRDLARRAGTNDAHLRSMIARGVVFVGEDLPGEFEPVPAEFTTTVGQFMFTAVRHAVEIEPAGEECRIVASVDGVAVFRSEPMGADVAKRTLPTFSDMARLFAGRHRIAN